MWCSARSDAVQCGVVCVRAARLESFVLEFGAYTESIYCWISNDLSCSGQRVTRPNATTSLHSKYFT